MLEGGDVGEQADVAFAEDLEEETDGEARADDEMAQSSRTALDPAKVRAELVRVEGFARRARELPHDSKAASLVQAVRLVMDRPEDRRKVVIFTESLATQDYLRELLLAQTRLADEDITLFRGINDSPRALAALRVWREEVEVELSPHLRPSSTVALRLALVHEFRTRSLVFISSEAGAKGLNLQFCDTLINYDLPWNPQRIEQRIGRCHRYGQERDVTIINFLATDNEAQRLTFDILSTKLDLFGKVLDMSDVVLQTPRSEASEELASALGPDFENQVRRIWERARSVQEVEDELRRLRDTLETRRQELERVRERTVGLIERRFDESVRNAFRRIQSDLPKTLAELDAELERVLTNYLDAAGIAWGTSERRGRRVVHVGASRLLPESIAGGITVALGGAHDISDIESLHMAHPLIEAAVDEARRTGSGSFRLRFQPSEGAPAAVRRRRGSRGRLALTKVAHRGLEREDRLRATAVFEDAEVLRPAEAALDLLRQPCEDMGILDPPLGVTAAHLNEVVEEELFLDQCAVSGAAQSKFETVMEQIDQYVADRVLVLRRARQQREKQLADAERSRDTASGGDSRAKADARVRRLEIDIERLDTQIADLLARDDEHYQHWKADAHQRRFEPPRACRLLTAEFVIA